MSRARRLVSVLLTLLILSSVFTAPVMAQETTTSTTTTTEPTPTCSAIDRFVYVATLGGYGLGVNAEICDPVRLSNDLANEDNQTKIDLYTHVSGVEANGDVTEAIYDNYQQDFPPAVWMKVEAAVAEAYKNGSTEAEARIAAIEAINDAYSRKQINLIENTNVSIATFRDVDDRAQIEGFGSNYVNSEPIAGSGSYLMEQGDPEQVINASTTLMNGSTHGMLQIYEQGYHDDTSSSMATFRLDATGFSGRSTDNIRVYIDAPSADYDRNYFLDGDDLAARWNALDTQAQTLKDQSDAYVNATWPDYQAGAINASDVLSRPTIMYEYGTDGNQFYNVLGALAQAGFDSPDLNNTGVMQINYKANQWTGVLFARNAPNGSWETNKTYNTSTIDGPVFVATTDGKKIDLEGEFQISEMTNKSGGSITHVNTTEYVYQTANTSELLDMNKQLIELIEQIEDRQTKAGGGSSGSGWSWDWLPDFNDPWLLAGVGVGAIALIGVLGVAIKLTRPF